MKNLIALALIASLGCQAQKIREDRIGNLTRIIDLLSEKAILKTNGNDTLIIAVIDTSKITTSYLFSNGLLRESLNVKQCNYDKSSNHCLRLFILGKNERINFTLDNWSSYNGYLIVDWIGNSISLKDIWFVKSDE